MSSAPTAYQSRRTVHLPAPTAWPIVLALGTTFLFAGIVMTWAISLLGTILMVCAAIGWFRDVLPRERYEEIAVITEIIKSKARGHRWSAFPLRTRIERSFRREIYLGAGVRGGIAVELR